MATFRRSVSALLLLAAVALAGPLSFRASEARQTETLLIVNARLADGTGELVREGALRVRGNRIAGIGKLSASPGEPTLDAHGLVLAPGFIDIHNHSLDGLDADPLAETQIAQGITTAIQGPDGESPWPIAGWIDARRKNPAAINVAVLAGHA